MALTKNKEREYKINVLTLILNTNIEIMKYYKKMTSDQKSINICNKSIRQSRNGIKILQTIHHIEIIRDLFNRFVVGKESYFALCGSLCSYSKINYWDTIEQGFKEFQKLQEQGIKEQEQELKERQRQKEIIQKAQEQGKTIEMVYDSETKKVKPVIVEEKVNA